MKKESMLEIKVKLEKVTKFFRNQEVLRNIDLEIHKGVCTGIIGSNGSGKTVLLKLICGLMFPQIGFVYVDEKRIGKDIDFPDRMGAIIETPGFIPYKSGLKNLLYLASIKNKIGKSQVEKAIRKVGLDPSDRKHVVKYSLGMKQRLGLAQAIMESPDLLILDEPMNGLDKNSVSEIRSLLLQLKEEGVTIIIASHLQADIDLLCDVVYEMDGGKLTKLG